MRTLIVGGPRTGKTTLGQQIAAEQLCGCRSTDEIVATHGWSSDASAEVATWMNAPGPWVIEGVMTARALRKWLSQNDGKPAERIVVLVAPRERRSPRQVGLAKSILTVWKQIVPTLIERKVRIDYMLPS